jgi:hypothetical protein
MSTRYYTEDTGWPGSDMVDGAQIKSWALNMLLHWSKVDTVSSKERNRNEAVFQIQHNRNPFIDHPEYANLIWGNPSGISKEENSILYVYPNPAADNCFIRLPEGMSDMNSNVTVFSMTGGNITPVLSFGEHKISLNLQGLAKGVYYLQLTNTKNSFCYHAKLMKE